MDPFVEILIPIGIFGGLFIYPALQYVAARRMRGPWRFWALLPLAPMGFVLVITLYALWGQSNVWPLPLIFVAPPTLLYLGVLFAVHALVAKRMRREE
jgi:hypothetical protein